MFPNCFRNYKGTFIWCDIFDTDVILPVSGSGEYVLKALEIIDVDSQGIYLANFATLHTISQFTRHIINRPVSLCFQIL